MRRFFVYLLLLTLVSGCNRQEIATRFWLDDLPDKPAQVPGEVAIQDARPEWEHRAFQGVFSLVPMENIEPSPIELLKRAFEKQMLELSDPPSKIRMELQSFRVVINTEDPVELHNDHSDSPSSSGSSSSGLGNIGGGGWEGAAFCAAVLVGVIAVTVLIGCAYVGTTELVHAVQHTHSRPKEFTGDYARGATCDARLSVVAEWPNGRRSEMQLREVVNHIEREFEYTRPYTMHDALGDSIRGVCYQMAHDWHEKLLHPASEVGTGTPTPVFTVHSGN
jgi:hypothetical protein